MNKTKVWLNDDLGKLLVRIPTGGLMLFHGIHKLIHGHGFIKSSLTEKGLPEIFWIGVPIAEVIAPILLILGIFGRISALLISTVMIFSLYLAHGMASFTLNEHGGLEAGYNIYFIFVGWAVFFSGTGKYSIYKSENKWLS